MKGIDELQKKLEELQEKLEEARHQFLQPGEQDDGAPNDQAGAAGCLNAVHSFLHGLGIEPPLLRPLREIGGAFGDAVERGVTPHLFRVKKRPKGGKPPRGIAHKTFRVVASVAVTKLMEAGEEEDDACTHATNKLTAMGFKIGNARRQTPAWHSLRDDREKVMSGRMGNIALKFYERLLKDIDPTPPREAAEKLLASLSKLDR